jgi:hypothetical protein
VEALLNGLERNTKLLNLGSITYLADLAGIFMLTNSQRLISQEIGQVLKQNWSYLQPHCSLPCPVVVEGATTLLTLTR